MRLKKQKTEQCDPLNIINETNNENHESSGISYLERESEEVISESKSFVAGDYRYDFQQDRKSPQPSPKVKNAAGADKHRADLRVQKQSSNPFGEEATASIAIPETPNIQFQTERQSSGFGTTAEQWSKNGEDLTAVQSKA